MTAYTASPHLPDPPPAAITPLLRTVLLCDLVESTALVERLGDSRVAQLLQRHDQLLARLLAEHHGQLIDKSDGALALFERPIKAVAFAMDYQRELRTLGQSANETLQARIGIHVGDVMTWTHTPAEVLAGAKPVEVEGLAKPVAARLMGLALPGQILLSGMAQNFAQRAQTELGERSGALQWRFHGRYRFKGVPAPMLVHEVGEAGLAPLKPPPSGAKAWRELPFWRKPPVLVVEALLLISLSAFGIYSTLRSPPAIAFAERDWVVVADFNNMTGQTLYDDALDSALRVGLEQSRYVNVLSDLQIEQALQRMQRTAQTLDRQTGSELALREGAKALVLPTISELGGRPRVSVEVVDPNSGVTVYTHMADASGSGGVVAALDDVLTDMRADLGESLASIQKNNVPLEKATTDNLEALRAFSLGVRAMYADKVEEAMAFYTQAIDHDPDFSMVYLRMGTVMYGTGNGAEAKRYLDLAAMHPKRLTNRESLLLDAARALLETPEKMLEKFKLLGTMYPDEYRAHYNFAFLARQDAQRYQEALTFLQPALTPRNFAQASAYYEQGMIYLSLDRLDNSIASFKQAESLGLGGRQGSYADAYAARREYTLAKQVLKTQPDSGVAGWVLEERRGEITYSLDQGQWQAAIDAANALSPAMANAPPLSQSSFALLRLSLRSYAPDGNFQSDLRDYLRRQIAELSRANALDRKHLVFQVLAAGWMAVQSGDVETARVALGAAGDWADKGGYPANADMARVLRAELELVAGKPDAAIALLAPRADSGDELYFLHAVLTRAYVAANEFEQALAQADWLAGHRGRAYGEINDDYAWQPANVIESNLALMAAARIAEKLNRADVAKARWADFDRAWPNGRQLPATVRRAKDF